MKFDGRKLVRSLMAWRDAATVMFLNSLLLAEVKEPARIRVQAGTKDYHKNKKSGLHK